MSRPSGSKNIKPTNSDEQELYRLLKQQAKNGDSNAAGWLLMLKQFNGQPPLKVMGGKVVEVRG